jgi:hypothetical protein
MKKSIFFGLLMILTGCSAQNTPDFILKHTDREAYLQKKFNQECHTYQQNRVIQVDGVVGYYDYTSNNGQACAVSNQQSLDTYQSPNRHAYDRSDVKPLTR